MNDYYPDLWTIIKVSGTDPHYRIFGIWYGSYARGELWRMNSGIVNVSETDDAYIFEGYTGSTYTCKKPRYGSNTFGYSIMNRMVRESDGTMEILEDMPEDIMNIDWIISK
jgi:hypothetical protein